MFRSRSAVIVIALFVFTVLSALGQNDDQLTHVVQPGENLYRIALRYGVDLDLLAQTNDITDMTRIFSGQVLIVPGLESPDASDEVVNPLVAGTPETHVVQRGESLTIIAGRYGVTVDAILQANNITNANHIEPGQELSIWTPQTVSEAAAEALESEEEAPTEQVEGAAPTVNTTYEVQEGEHLAQIAQRFGINWQVLARLNGISDPDRLLAGQVLTIPALNEDGTINDLGIVMPEAAVPEANAPIQGSIPTPTRTEGRQILVDLSDSRIYAFEDGELLRSVVVSTGLPATPTVQGEFTIWHRTESQTMSGPGYYLPNVQWVQYFYQGYGIHGTYWHNNFGQPMSHGCVNLPNDEAEWFYNFGDYGTSVRVQA